MEVSPTPPNRGYQTRRVQRRATRKQCRDGNVGSCINGCDRGPTIVGYSSWTLMVRNVNFPLQRPTVATRPTIALPSADLPPVVTRFVSSSSSPLSIPHLSPPPFVVCFSHSPLPRWIGICCFLFYSRLCRSRSSFSTTRTSCTSRVTAKEELHIHRTTREHTLHSHHVASQGIISIDATSIATRTNTSRIAYNRSSSRRVVIQHHCRARCF